MIKKIFFENYKPFGGPYEIELRPITLLVGKNSSGKSSISHLVSLLASLVGSHRKVEYRQCFSERLISLYSFHNLFTTGLKFGLTNENGAELYLGFARNLGKLFLCNVEMKTEKESFTKEYPSDQMPEVVDNVDFIEPLLNEWGGSIKDWFFTSNYIGPVRNLPSSSVIRFNESNVGEIRCKGENTFDVLIDSFKGDKSLLESVSSWLKENMDGQVLSISNLVTDFYSVSVDNGRGAMVPLEEVGEGVSQVLPIIVQSFLNETSDINIVEQPVLHLHPAAHASVADRLIESIGTSNKSYLIESHSANVLLAIRRAVCDPKINLSSSDVVVYFVDNDDQNQITRIDISDNGELSSWPTGVFGEGFELMKDIMRMQK